jgi:hypothetical protein
MNTTQQTYSVYIELLKGTQVFERFPQIREYQNREKAIQNFDRLIEHYEALNNTFEDFGYTLSLHDMRGNLLSYAENYPEEEGDS